MLNSLVRGSKMVSQILNAPNVIYLPICSWRIGVASAILTHKDGCRTVLQIDLYDQVI